MWTGQWYELLEQDYMMFYKFSIFIGILKLPSVEHVLIYTLTSSTGEWLSAHPHHYEVLAYLLLVRVGEKGISWSLNGHFSSSKSAWPSCHRLQSHSHFPFRWTVSFFSLSVTVCLTWDLLIYWGNDLSSFRLLSQFLTYDIAYGAFSYIDFHLICTYLNLLIFLEAYSVKFSSFQGDYKHHLSFLWLPTSPIFSM